MNHLQMHACVRSHAHTVYYKAEESRPQFSLPQLHVVAINDLQYGARRRHVLRPQRDGKQHGLGGRLGDALRTFRKSDGKPWHTMGLSYEIALCKAI